MQRKIYEALVERLEEDEQFQTAFCADCFAVHHDPGGRYNPPEDICPCDFYIGDSGCARAEEWTQIDKAIAAAAEIVADALDSATGRETISNV